MHVQMQKSHLIYARKHSGVLGYAAARLIYLVTSMLRLGVFATVRLVKSNDDAKARVRLALAAVRYHLTSREPS